MDHIAREAPHRAVLAVRSEIVRMTSLACFAGLCALLMWLTAAAALARSSSGWAAFTLVLALGSSAIALAALFGIVEAAVDLRRVRALVDA